MNRKLLIILLLALFLRLLNLNQSFWMDEAAQALESVRPLFQQLQIPNDFHPPLYHLYVHLFTYISTQEWWLRLTSVIAGIGTVFLLYKIGQSFTKSKFGHLSALFLAIAPYHIYYSQELRMYALSAFFSTLSVYALLHKKWFLYLISIATGLYTIYLFPFIIIAHGLWILLFNVRQLTRWTLITSFSILTFLPWLPSLLTQMQGGTQLPEIWPQWRQLSSLGFYKTLPMTYAKFALGRITFDSNLLYGAIILASSPFFLYPLYQSIRPLVSKLSFPKFKQQNFTSQQTSIALIILTLTIPFLLAWIISLWIPLNGPWRLLLILPMFYLLLALGITNIKTSSLRIIAVAGIAIFSLLGTIFYHSQPQFQREQWRLAVSFLEQRTLTSSQPVIILNAFPEPFAPIEWYATPTLPVVGVLDSLKVDPQTIHRQMIAATDQISIVYYFEYLQDLTDPNREIITWLETHGYQLLQTHNFPGVGFIHEYHLDETQLFAEIPY